MNKKRIYEYAEEVNVKNKEIIDELKRMSVEVSGHIQALEDDQIKMLNKEFKSSKNKENEKQDTQNNHQRQQSKKNDNQNKSNSKEKNNRNSKNNKNNKNNKRGENNKPAAEPKKVPSKITYEEDVVIEELTDKLNIESSDVIKKLFLLGIVANTSQSLDEETLGLTADNYGIRIEKEVVVNEEDLATYFDDEEGDPDIVGRPAAVTIMGHVDRGRTILLDSIRSTKVTAGEAGGIAQHIGTYQVENNGRKITFLDTPGYTAFVAMRARGAQVTDVAILVVAADDGIMPRAIGAINHTKEADVPTIVAANKVDRPAANSGQVMQELAEYGLIPEDWGGDAISVPLSALNDDGIDGLLEMIGLAAGVQELKANPDKQTVGTVIEAELDRSRGPVASLLVQNGTLHVGSSIVVGNTHGRVRAMVNDLGQRIKAAGPFTPAGITGISDIPQAGGRFTIFKDEKQARRIGEAHHEANMIQRRQESKNVPLDNLFEQVKQGGMKDLNVIIKSGVRDSVRALAASLVKVGVEGVNVHIIHMTVGAINESDVTLADASNSIIVGFNVRPDTGTKRTAEARNVDMRLHGVIYGIIEEIESAMKGLLDPEFEGQVIRQAEVRRTFKVSKVGTIAGSYVTEGKITYNAGVRVIRNGIVQFESELDTLKRFKDDAKRVSQGYEYGITITNFNDIKEGDIIETFEMIEIEG